MSEQQETIPPPPENPKTLKERLFDLWASLDWSKSNAELSYELDCHLITVAKWREIVTGMEQQSIIGKKIARRLNIDWESLDWDKNNYILSRETGVGVATINAVRRQLRKQYPTIHSHHRKFSDAALDAIDWEFERDIDIARKIGVSRERVRQIRAVQRRPECKVRCFSDPSRVALLKWVLQHKDALQGKTMHEAYALLPDCHIKRQLVYEVLKRSGIQFETKLVKKFKDRNLEIINWKLPDTVITLIYGLNGHVAANARCQYNFGRPAWRVSGFSSAHKDPELLAAIEEEKKKAKAAGVAVDDKRISDWLEYKNTSLNRLVIKSQITKSKKHEGTDERNEPEVWGQGQDKA
jgi:hypothetical protein